MNAYGYRDNVRARRNRSAISMVIRFLRAVFEVICERITASGVRMAAVVFSFVVALGIIGGMEIGMISLYIGLPVCLVIACAALLMHFDD
ncbi:MAG: hypothetical protein IJA60_03250 [Clostridia bacterium]|nr:hypothetical protein [Clostridia bacterium]